MAVKVTKKEANVPFNQKKIRVAAYARVSTSSEEQLSSLKTQKEHYENTFLNNDCYKFVGIYYDEGISGTKIDKRDGLLSLLKDCDAGKIDRVVTKSISRFSRNITDCLEMVRHLSKINVSILFEKENIDTAHMSSELMLSILSSIAESESKSLSQNIKWSAKRRFEEGTYVIATPPYGYNNIDGKMIVNKEEAKIVKEIFNMALSGIGAYTIANKLDQNNIPPRKGTNWSGASVRDILKNISYTGDVIFQKTYRDENYKQHINRGEENMYLCKDHHEAIISTDDFELVQSEIERRSKEKGHREDANIYWNRYVFSERIICGECGANFKRKICYSTNGNCIIWSCRTHIQNKEKCSMKAVKETTLKLAFVRMINKLQVTRNQIIKPFVSAIKITNNKSKLHQINKLEENINKNREQQQVLKNLVTSGYLEPDVYSFEINNLVKEENELDKEKQNLSKSVTGDLTHLHEAEKLLKFLNQDEKLTEFDDDLFLDFVEKIIVKDRNTFVFNLKCGLNFTEVIEL